MVGSEREANGGALLNVCTVCFYANIGNCLSADILPVENPDTKLSSFPGERDNFTNCRTTNFAHSFDAYLW